MRCSYEGLCSYDIDISNEDLEKLCLLIDSERKQIIQRFINKKDKIRTLIGEVLIRTIIAEE